MGSPLLPCQISQLTSSSHSKADCPNPRVFTGTCRICEKQGHPAALCPDKPPVKCFNCKQEGHLTSECTAKRLMNTDDVPEMEAGDAWEMLEKADKDRDLDEFRTVSEHGSTLCLSDFL